MSAAAPKGMTMRLHGARNVLAAFGVGLVMVAALWGAIHLVIAHNRSALRASTEVNVGNLTRVFAEHVRRTVTMIDLALQDYRDHHRANPDAPLEEGWRNAYLKEGGVFQWAVIDAHGMMAFSNLAPVATAVDLSDREHFRVHRESGRDELFISRPVFGRLSQRWSIQFTRRLSKPDGSFAGVVVVSVEPDYFIDDFEAIDTGPAGVTLLAGLDRVVRARFQQRGAGKETGKEAGKDTGKEMGEEMGAALPPDTPFLDPVRPTGFALLAAPGNGARFHSGWRQVKGFPLVAAVQIADADVLAHAADVERNLGIVGILFTAVLLGGASGIGDLLRRRDRAQAQLAQHAEELRLANAEVERLAYVAAHDLQEPLRTITSYSQLVSANHGASLDAEGREWLEEVVSAASRMKQLLRDIQLYLAEKSLPLPGGSTPAQAALKAALGQLAQPVKAAAAELDIAPLPAVRADARRLTEIFAVLLANAVQYRAPGRPLRIRVSAHREGGFDVIAVEDNGIGIEPQYVERIFGVFQRLHSRADHPGTGMGLAIVQKMVHRLGGRVTVDSTPGAGSVFSVHLPILTAEAPDDRRNRQAVDHPAGRGRSGGRGAGPEGPEAGTDPL